VVNGVGRGDPGDFGEFPDPSVAGRDQDFADVILQLAKQPPRPFQVGP